MNKLVVVLLVITSTNALSVGDDGSQGIESQDSKNKCSIILQGGYQEVGDDGSQGGYQEVGDDGSQGGSQEVGDYGSKRFKLICKTTNKN